MLTISLSLCLVLLLSAAVIEICDEASYLIDAKEVGFSYKHYPEAAGWFKLNPVPANWAEARLRCNLDGAVLASPLNANLLNALKEVMANHVHCGIFSGIHATISKGDYFSVEGVPLSEIPVGWAPNEPDNFEDNESCLMMLANGTMADVKCTEVFPYVCYKKDVDISKSVCGTADKEYRMDSRTGSCYKFHHVSQTWARAYMTCAAEGAFLGIINSAVESQVFKELFGNFKDKDMILSRNTGAAFIGFHDWDKHGTWRTIHGDTLKDAGFEKWSGGQPDNARNDEYCGCIFRSGELNDIPWHYYLAFICEKKANH